MCASPPAASPRAPHDDGIPAATVVIFRQGDEGQPELLMVQRSRQLRFAGGAAVFPGGKVDPGDRTLAAQLYPDADQTIAAGRIAAIRETLEETGLAIALRDPITPDEAAAARRMLFEEGLIAPVLERFGWTLQTERLSLYSHWRAPTERGFDTLFFVHDLGTGAVDVAVDATENTRLFWCSAAQALAMADAGEIDVIFPTRRNLERLAQFDSYAGVLEDIAKHPVRRIRTRQVERNGELWLQIPEGLGYPVLGQPLAETKRG